MGQVVASLAAGAALPVPNATAFTWAVCDARPATVFPLLELPARGAPAAHLLSSPGSHEQHATSLPPRPLLRLGDVRALAERLAEAARSAPASAPTAAERRRALRYAKSLRATVRQRAARARAAGGGGAARPTLPRARGDIALGMSASEQTRARERICRERIVHDVGEGLGDAMGVTMSTYFLGSIGDALVNFMVKPIGAIFGVLLLLLFLCFVANDFISKMTVWQDMILPAAVGQMMPPIVTSYVAQALSQSLSLALSEALYITMLRALDMSLMSQITAVFTIQANPMLHHKILHTVTGGVVRDTTRSLSLRIIQIVAHSVTHTVTHSIIHHYYCIYCYFHGAYCNYCYYYGEYQWLHELWDEKDAERGTSPK